MSSLEQEKGREDESNPSQVQSEQAGDDPEKGPTRRQLVEELERKFEADCNLPEHAKYTLLTQVDLQYYMLLIVNILKRDCHE